MTTENDDNPFVTHDGEGCTLIPIDPSLLSICSKCAVPVTSKPLEVVSWVMVEGNGPFAVVLAVTSERLKVPEPFTNEEVQDVIALMEHTLNKVTPHGAVAMISLLPEEIVHAAESLVMSQVLREAAEEN